MNEEQYQLKPFCVISDKKVFCVRPATKEINGVEHIENVNERFKGVNSRHKVKKRSGIPIAEDEALLEIFEQQQGTSISTLFAGHDSSQSPIN